MLIIVESAALHFLHRHDYFPLHNPILVLTQPNLLLISNHQRLIALMPQNLALKKKPPASSVMDADRFDILITEMRSFVRKYASLILVFFVRSHYIGMIIWMRCYVIFLFSYLVNCEHSCPSYLSMLIFIARGTVRKTIRPVTHVEITARIMELHNEKR